MREAERREELLVSAHPRLGLGCAIFIQSGFPIVLPISRKHWSLQWLLINIHILVTGVGEFGLGWGWGFLQFSFDIKRVQIVYICI